MANGIERLIARALDAQLCGRDGYGVARLAEQMGRPERTVRNWVSGVCAVTAPDLLLAVSLIQAEDPTRATLLWADLSRIVRHTVAPVDAPQADKDPLPIDCLQAEADLADVGREIASHGSETDPHEARRALPKVRTAAGDMAVIAAKLEAIAARTPQRSLQGV